MKRFTVSLPDDVYAAVRRRGEVATPPASLQQMIRYAVDTLLNAPETAEVNEPESALREPAVATVLEPTDLLAFSVREVTYGIPIEMVETVAAGLAVHVIPTTSDTLVGVAAFRNTLTEVHDGGIVLQGRVLGEESDALLAVPGGDGRVLLAVSSVFGLSPAGEAKWAPPPPSSLPWVSALVWTTDSVVTVIDPRSFNL
ncbi:MAG: chemotaxis protein CheW [Acidimicrobiia bacterium]|nr:chemotaxis protein CheW [Acidimicrobiia bacterium]